MGLAKKLIDKKVLRDLVPINALSAVHIEEISKKAVIADVRAGRFVFRKGDRDYQSVYLLEGKIELLGDKGDVVGQVKAGSETARHPLAHKQPRQLSARAVGNVTIACVDSSLLDVLLTWDESAGYDVVEIDAQDDDDWMTRMLQSQAFLQLPPSNIHQLLMRLEMTSARAGDVVVRQGDEGDYFYIVKSGRLAVTRKPSARGKDVLLAELSEGACFGEEALVSDAKRNASVTMITDGDLMRLSKQDFRELLCTPLVHEIDVAKARELASQGAQWLDVRLPGEFENQAITGSRNMPLSALRDEASQLDTGVTYILCCDTGRRSAAGAFVLGQRGFSVYALKKGLMEVPEDMLTAMSGNASPQDHGPVRDADIIPFETESREPAEQGSDVAAGEAAQSVSKAVPPDAAADDLPSRLTELQEKLEKAHARIAEADARCNEEQAISERLALQVESLERDLERLNSEREAMGERLQRDAEQGESRNNELREAVAALEQQQRAQEKQSRQLDQELTQVRNDYRQLGQRASALGGERDAAVRDLERARSEIESLKQQLSSRQGEASDQVQALETLLEQRDRELEEARNRHHHLEQQLDERCAAHQALEQEINTLAEQADAQATEKDRLVADLEEARQQLGGLQSELEAAGERERALQQQFGELEKTSAESLQQVRDEASRQQQALDRQIVDLQAQLNDRQQLIDAGDTSRRELEDKLAEANRGLEQARQSAQEALAGAEEAARAAEDSIERIRSEASSAQHALNEQISELGSRLDEKERLLEEQETRHGETQRHIDELRQERDALSQAGDSTHEKLQQTEQQLEETRTSLEQAAQQAGELEQKLTVSQQQHADAESRARELESRLEGLAKDHESDLASVRGALGRAQDERENVKRDQKRLMESLRKAENALAEARRDHEAEVYRLRRELKQSAGEANSGLAAEMEALQEQLKEQVDQREELELKLGTRSEQLEGAQLQVERLNQQLEQARDSARQAEQQLVEATRSADQEMTVRLQAEQEARQALSDALENVSRERDGHQERLTVLAQETEELRIALKDMEKVRADAAESQRQISELRELSQQAEAERDQLRESQQRLQQENDQLRAEAEVTRGLVDMAPSDDSDVATREELLAVKKNVEVAVRLRSQAEARAAELEQEVLRLETELRQASEQGGGEIGPARIPSLDASDPQASAILDPGPFDTGREEADEVDAALPGAASVLLDGSGVESSRAGAGRDAAAAENRAGGRWKSMLAGVLIGALAASAGAWWMQQYAVGDKPARAEPEQVVDTAGTPPLAAPPAASPEAPSDVPPQAPPKSAPKVEPESAPPAAWGLPEDPRPLSRDPGVERDASERSDSAGRQVSGEAGDAAPGDAEDEIPVVRQPSGYFRDRLSNGEAGPAMVELNADHFQMGSGPASPNFDERPRHEVRLKRFAISRYETTFEEYDRFAADTGKARPNDAGWGRGRRPVVNVSWQDASAYAEWLSRQTGHRYRLPTEAEWEFAARAGGGKRFWWGNEVGEARANCFDCAGPGAGRSTVTVGSFEPSSYGVYDMAGNVREWVHDCYKANYADAPRDGSAVDPAGCSERVVRGGGFSSASDKLRSTARDASPPQSRLNDTGFRVVRED